MQKTIARRKSINGIYIVSNAHELRSRMENHDLELKIVRLEERFDNLERNSVTNAQVMEAIKPLQENAIETSLLLKSMEKSISGILETINADLKEKAAAAKEELERAKDIWPKIQQGLTLLATLAVVSGIAYAISVFVYQAGKH